MPASPSSVAPPAAELLIDHCGPLRRAAMVQQGRLTDLHVDRLDRHEAETGSIWLGRVERIATGLNGAFVDLGTGRSGLLSAADTRLITAGAPVEKAARPASGTAIGTLLRAGQAVLVQVKAEAFGTKGPTLSMDISIPGRFLVHAPARRGVTLSRRVGSGPVRAALARRLQVLTVGDGWIARSGTEAIDDDLIATEAAALALMWRTLCQRTTTSAPPLCLVPGSDAGQRAVIGHGARPWARVVIETADPGACAWAATFRSWCDATAPDLLQYFAAPDPAPGASSGRLFDRHDLANQIQALAQPRVKLAGGASLVIERTEALTAIDVNAGERGSPLAVNLEAAVEIGRQLRLRNIGGIIVVDFVSMTRAADGQHLLDRLGAAVASDPVQTEVYGLSKLGLVELSRARRGPSLLDLLQTDR